MVSIDDFFTAALDGGGAQDQGRAQQKQPTQQQEQRQGTKPQAARGGDSEHLLHRLDNLQGPQLREVGGAAGEGPPARAERAEPGESDQLWASEAPLWAAEQRARWGSRPRAGAAPSPPNARNPPPAPGAARDAAATSDALRRLMAEVDAEGPTTAPAIDAGAGTDISDMEEAAEALRAAIDGLDAVTGRGAAAAGDAASAAAAAATPPRSELGSSGLPPFVAAAKALRSPAPNRLLLSGVLEAVEQERAELQRALLKKRMERELGGARSPGSGSDSDANDPYAKPVRQLLEDLARAR